MRKRNNIFAEAFKWLKKNVDGIRYQKDLAAKIGVSEDTITRIMRDQTEVTDDFLCKFNDAFDNVFNYQWLRGEDSVHMLAADLANAQKNAERSISIEPAAQIPDMSSVFNSALAAKDDAIESLKRELRTKDELIQSLHEQLATKDQLIAEQKARLVDYRRLIDSHEIENSYPFPVGVADGSTSQKRA